MFRVASLVISSLLLSLAATFPAAASAEWRVAQTKGIVRIVSPSEGMQPVSLNAAVSPGATIATGGDGHVLLQRGPQEIVISANSRMTLPAEQAEGFTRVFQDLGTLMFRVDKRQVQHFEVETPIVAAVVKGTTFTVSSGPLGDTIHVAEGLVEVRSLSSGAFVDVPGGETAFVSRSAPDTIQLDTRSDGPQKADAGPGAQRFAENGAEGVVITAALGDAPVDLKGVTDGLVSFAQTPQTAQLRPSREGLLGAAAPGVTNVSISSAALAASLPVEQSLSASLPGAGEANLSASLALAPVAPALPGASVDAGASLSLPAGNVGANLGADLGGINAGVGVDVGAGGANVTADVGSIGVNLEAPLSGGGGVSIETPIVDANLPLPDSGGLLDGGLLNGGLPLAPPTAPEQPAEPSEPLLGGGLGGLLGRL